VGPARLNPAMVRRLAADHGVDLTSGELARLAYGTRRLDPAPALETLRGVAGAVPGMHVEHRLLVSTFADLHDRPADLSVVARTAVVRDLARLKAAAVGRIPQVEEISHDAPPLDERDPRRRAPAARRRRPPAGGPRTSRRRGTPSWSPRRPAPGSSTPR
jgi:hypothetical protein